MGNSPLIAAIEHVVNEDEMTPAYRDRLTALIKNSMQANYIDSDIEALLEMIEITDTSDED